MLDALPETVRFYCPNCGAGFRASRVTGGTVMACHGCGEQIRVPRHQHPIECTGDDAPLLSPAVAAGARGGVRLLLIGLSLVVVQFLIVLIAYASWYWASGPVQFLERDTGAYRRILVAVWVLDLLLVLAQTAVKWLGYQRCEAMATAVDSSGWITGCRYAVLMRAFGYAIACWPWLQALPVASISPIQKALVQIGHLAWIIGIVFEFGILFVWFRVLSEIGGMTLSRCVTRFLFATAASLVIGAVSLALAAISLVMVLRPNGHSTTTTLPADRPNLLAAMPNDGWYTLGTLSLMLLFLALFMLWQYVRILITTDHELATLSGSTSRS